MLRLEGKINRAKPTKEQENSRTRHVAVINSGMKEIKYSLN